MKVFISYRRDDWGFVRAIAQQLRQRVNGSIFVDYMSIDEADFEKSILSHLRNSTLVILIVTKHTFAPERINRPEDWVHREIALALHMNKPIIMACIDNILPPPASTLPADIRNITRMEGVPFYFGQRFFEAAMENLLEVINRFEGKAGDTFLQKSKDALLRGDYTSARRELEKVIDALQDYAQPQDIAQGKYLQALILLHGRRPFVQTYSTIREVENLMQSALSLHQSYSYLVALALFKLDFSNARSLSQFRIEATNLLQQASTLAPTSVDVANIDMLATCQPELVADYL